MEPLLKYAEQPELVYGKNNSQLPIFEDLGQDDSDSGVLFLFWNFGVILACSCTCVSEAYGNLTNILYIFWRQSFPATRERLEGDPAGGNRWIPVSSFGACLPFTKVMKSACPVGGEVRFRQRRQLILSNVMFSRSRH